MSANSNSAENVKSADSSAELTSDYIGFSCTSVKQCVWPIYIIIFCVRFMTAV